MAFEFVGSAPQFAHAFANLSGEFREFVGAKQHQHQQKNNEDFGSSRHNQRMLTARAASSEMMISEMSAWIIRAILAQRDKTGASVALNAVEVLNERNR